MVHRIFFTLAVLLSIAWLVAPDTGAQPLNESIEGDKLQELLRERHDTLKQRFDAVKTMYDSGRIQYDRVASAHDDLLNAKLQLASAKTERVEICKKRVDNFRLLEAFENAIFETGRGTLDAKLLSTATRLQAEIDCIREESDPE